MRSVQSSHLRLTRIAACALAALALVTACAKKDAAPGPEGGKTPAPEVGVITTRFEPVALQTELPARVDAFRGAQVRARVNGVGLKRLFTGGSEVQEGQARFQIDPEPYQAQLNGANAASNRADAS